MVGTPSARIPEARIAGRGHPGHVQLSLSYSLVRCSCGTARQAGLVCPQCGCAPEEVDEDVERRRQIVAALSQEAGAVPAGTVDPQALADLWSVLTGWLQAYLDAYQRTAEGTVEEAAGRLRDVLAELALMRARIDAAEKRRPYLASWRAAERILDLYDRLVASYTAALVAPTPADAQREGDAAQLCLDEAAATIGRYNAVAEEHATLEAVGLGDDYGDLVVGARGAFNLAGATSLVELEESGAQLYERIAGTRECPVGLGVQLQMLNLIVEAVFDDGRFWRVAATMHDAVLARREPLALLVQDEQWRHEFGAVVRESRDAGQEASAVQALTSTRRRDIRSGIRLGAVITERLAPPLLATLLALAHRTTYERERAKDVRTLLREVQAAGFADVTGGIDLALRDADAHNEFTVTDAGVEFSSTRREYDFLRDDELLDRILMGLESVSAMHTGITAALPTVGIDAGELVSLITDTPPQEDILRILMGLNGWADVAVTSEGQTLTLRGRRDAETPVGVGVTLAQWLDGVEELVLEGDGIGRRRIARGPVEPLRRLAAEGAHEKTLATLETLATWTIDGKHPIAASALRKIIAYQTLEAVSLPPADEEAASRLAAIASLLDRLAARGLLRQRLDRRLRAAVSAATDFRERSTTGAATREEARQVADALTRLMPESVPELRSTW